MRVFDQRSDSDGPESVKSSLMDQQLMILVHGQAEELLSQENV